MEETFLADYKVRRATDSPGLTSITGLEDDIALLEMEEHFNLEIITPACLSRN